MRRQRTTKLLLFGTLALALTLGFSNPAAAQDEEPVDTAEIQGLVDQLKDVASTDAGVHELEALAEENGGTEFDAHCIALLTDGDSVNDCQKSPNPLLPETNELIWGGIGFAVVFFALAKFGVPAMKQAMDTRTERIRNDLQQAEDQRSDAEGLKAEYTAQLNDAKAEAGRILDEARQTAEQVKRDRESELQTELAAAREQALAEIETSKATATDDLRGELASLAVGAAEAVIQRNLDPETQNQLVEEYIDRVATTSRA